MALSKTKKLSILCLLINWVFNNSLCAQVADLQLNFEIDNIENGVEFGQTGAFIVTLSNLGPNDAGITSDSNLPVGALSDAIAIAISDGFVDVLFSQNFNLEEDCFFIRIDGSPIPGGQPHVAFSVNFPIIPVNSTMTCHGFYTIGFKEGSRTITWRAISGYNNMEIDPNPDNNKVSLVFRIKPPIIPTLSFYSLTLMILFIIGLTQKSRYGFYQYKAIKKE